MKSEKQHIIKFVESFIIPIDRLDYDSEVSFIDFLILDAQTKQPKMCIEFKKDTTPKEKMFEQLQHTKGIVDMGDSYEGLFGAINKTHFYIKDNDWNDILEFDLNDVTKIQNWLRNNLVSKEGVSKDYWKDIFVKCGFVLDESIFDNTITYEKVLAEKNKYIQNLFSIFTGSFGGVNVDLSFADMFLNEIGASNSLSQYKKRGLEFNNIILDDGYRLHLQLRYQELIFEHHQRKSQGAYYTKLNVTGMMWAMIRKHINIDDYYIWDPCCGTGNLFKDINNEVFDFIDKDKLYLSDKDKTAVDICKNDRGFNAGNVFGYDYQKTIINNFVDEQCFQFDYQSTIVDNFVGMPTKLQKIIKENPKDLFVVCNPPYRNTQGTSHIKTKEERSEYTKSIRNTICASTFRTIYNTKSVDDLFLQYMIWTNEQQIKKAKKCYIVPCSWIYNNECKDHPVFSLNVFRKKLNQNFIDMLVISNCEFENVARFYPIGVFLVGNDKGEYSWKNLKIPVIFPENKIHKEKFIKEMNKINKKYDLKKHLPKLQFKFEK
ncbi:MAG: hypothetical protein FWG85_04570 [Bacteroidetes bacterium]|nr:hypothetical protein [Bacteroidota bacterium]